MPRYKKGDKVRVKRTYGGWVIGTITKVHPVNKLGQRYYSVSDITYPLTARHIRKA